MPKHEFVFLGLTITSTWGNGHATTYRGLLKQLAAKGHKVTFLERDMPWYAGNREFDSLPYCDVMLYSSLAELKERFSKLISSADVVIVGSYVPDGIEIGRWVTSHARNLTAFYDIDTPVTVSNLLKGKCEYLAEDLVSKYALYLSFTGGPILSLLQQRLSSPCARALYCSVDPTLYFPQPARSNWDLGYLGTYAADRQPTLQALLLDAAISKPRNRFVVAGPQYPSDISWPANVDRIEHLGAGKHREFYSSQKFTLNVTRRDMVRAGYSPSVRLFEAAACGTPILTDEWPGLETFFVPGWEILPVHDCVDVTSNLCMSDSQRLEIGERARLRTLRNHTAEVRAGQLETYVRERFEELCRSNRKATVSGRGRKPVMI